MPDDIKRIRASMKKLTSKQRVAGAVKFIRQEKGTMQWKTHTLKKMGLTDMEITEALNEASGGEIVRSALGR
jgi:hypothetical protein